LRALPLTSVRQAGWLVSWKWGRSHRRNGNGGISFSSKKAQTIIGKDKRVKISGLLGLKIGFALLGWIEKRGGKEGSNRDFNPSAGLTGHTNLEKGQTGPIRWFY